MAALNLPEYYADLAQTTLSSNYTAASGSIVVTSATALNAGTGRQFHFMITAASNSAVLCIGKATALASSTFTVVMTDDANASIGDFVTIIQCAASQDQIISDCNQMLTFANLPATVPPAGRKVKQKDGPYEWISDGTNWQAFWNGWPVTLPPTSSWTNENMSSNNAFVHYTNGFGYLIGAGSAGSDALSMTYRTAPSTPYTITVRFIQDGSGLIQSVNAGGGLALATAGGFSIGWRDSGGKYLVLMFDSTSSGNFLVLTKWNSFTSISGNVFSLGGNSQLAGLFSKDVIVQLTNDGTNLKIYVGIDKNNMALLNSQAIATFLADATSLAWGTYLHTNSAAISLIDWTQS